MTTALTALTAALGGSLWLALLGAFGLGVASVLLSPCHLASIPLVVAVVSARAGAGRGAASVALRFGAGIIAAFAVIGSVTVALGRIAGDLGSFGTYGGAAILILVGLDTLEVLRLPWFRAATTHSAMQRSGPLMVGFLFGATLGPCTFAFLAPAVGLAFSLAQTNPLQSGLLLATFSLAHVGVLVLAGTFGASTERFVRSRGSARVVASLRGFVGLVLVAAGVWLLGTGR